jgi:transposase-like protein
VFVFMDRAWLERELASGRSIESIAVEVAKDPSTVSYWVRKFGLRSAHAERHAPRGGIERDVLERLVEAGATTRAIAAELGVSQSTVRHWLRRHGLSTRRRRVPAEGATVMRECRTHGLVEFVRYSPTDSYRCRQCRYDSVTRRRRKVKEMLVAEFGGACQVCGYDRYAGALQFHHRDPEAKAFGLALYGAARSFAKAREEAAKCVLLCANCHAEIERGLASLPPAPGHPG